MAHTTIPRLDDNPVPDSERLAILERVDEILELLHRSADLGNFDDPLDEAIYILLSRQTREQGYQRAYSSLRDRWPTWTILREAAVADVAAVLKPAGFGPTRARQLKGLLDAVAAECARRELGVLTLDWLRDLTDSDAERFLVSLPGIGVKSARCVMLYALRRDVFAVDTHVQRILDRLSVVPDPGGKVKVAVYDTIIPARLRKRLHINLVHHGRAYCTARSPMCHTCPLISFCRPGQATIDTRHGTRTTAKEKGTKDRRPVAVELFAGGGGMGLGFSRAGFDIAVAVEIDRDAAQTYRVNHPGTVVIEADAAAITTKDLIRVAPRARRAEAIIAGPPCQGYSAAGKRKAADDKNRLYEAVIALAADLRPRFVVIENVPGIIKVEGVSFVETIVEALEGAGYSAGAHLLRACDFGVPQLRRRMLFLAQRAEIGASPKPPRPTHCPGNHCEQECGIRPGRFCGRPATPTVVNTLAGLPLLAAGQEAEYLKLDGESPLLNGSTMVHSVRVVKKIKSIKTGEGPISYRRLHHDVARTIVAGHRALPVHPFLHRTLSVREAARIQGFDDTHVFCGSRSQQPLQVANAVPAQLAEAVASAMLDEARSG